MNNWFPCSQNICGSHLNLPLAFYTCLEDAGLHKGTTYTVGSMAKGEESPTSPPVNEAVGAWIWNPNFASTKASSLSESI